MKAPTARRQSTDSVPGHSHYSPYPPAASPHAFSKPPLPSPQQSLNQSTSSSIGGDGQQYKVARAISSCTRCRSRKQKCDGELPACSACKRAKVECIGFDAISKTNVSRNYLHSLEQEIASLRAQVASLTGSADSIGQTKREIASVASLAVASYSRPEGFAQWDSSGSSSTTGTPRQPFVKDLNIDPALQGPDGDAPPRSPWDSPIASSFSSAHSRRHSEFPYPPAPFGSDSPRSPSTLNRPHPTGQHPVIHATSLTRMVADAALRTGHATNHVPVLNPVGTSSVSGSIKGGEGGSGSERGSSVKDSPAGSGVIDTGDDKELAVSPENTSTKSGPSASHLSSTNVVRGGSHSSGTALGSSASIKSKRRDFNVPPLPPQGAVERLVAAYVDFVGVTAPIIHIPSLGKQLIRIRQGHDVEQSDIFVVMMVLALSTMASSRFVDPPDELRACSEAFHAEAMKHLDAVFEEQSYVGLQAILLLVWYSLLNPDKGSIWFLVGLATRTCVDLGFHNEHNTQVETLDALEIDMRRRLFWCTYKMDRLLSQSLGRPPAIPDGFINVPLPSCLHDVDIHPGQYGAPAGEEPCSYKAVFIHTTRLRQLQSEILTNTYGINGSDGPKPEWFDNCFERLKVWLATTPEPRGTVSSEGFAISFHNSCLLLFRPSPGCPRPGRRALETVLASSSYIIRIYRRMQLNNRISWLWMTSHFSFMAGLSFLYAFFNLYSMGGGSGVPTVEEAMMDIESCLAVLEYLSPRVPSASACHDTMRSVSQAIMEQLSTIDQKNPSRANSTSTLSPGSSLGGLGSRSFRGAPISSSRDDPMPSEGFPAPLPPTTLPYELSLLDNLFFNPMAPHNKASDYTNGKKSGLGGGTGLSGISGLATGFSGNATGMSSVLGGSGNSNNNGPPIGFPPGAFQSNFTAPGNNGIGPYGMAAVGLNTFGNGGGFLGGLDGTNMSGIPSDNSRSNVVNGTMGINGGTSMGQSPHGSAALYSQLGGVNTLSDNGTGVTGTTGDPSFDIFSFLMDEEGGLGGTGTWDALEVPPDFSLWS